MQSSCIQCLHVKHRTQSSPGRLSLQCSQHAKHILNSWSSSDFPLLFLYPFLSSTPFFANSTFELTVDIGSLFEFSFSQASVAFLVFALYASYSSDDFTDVSLRIPLFFLFLFYLSVFFLSVTERMASYLLMKMIRMY